MHHVSDSASEETPETLDVHNDATSFGRETN